LTTVSDAGALGATDAMAGVEAPTTAGVDVDWGTASIGDELATNGTAGTVFALAGEGDGTTLLSSAADAATPAGATSGAAGAANAGDAAAVVVPVVVPAAATADDVLAATGPPSAALEAGPALTADAATPVADGAAVESVAGPTPSGIVRTAPKRRRLRSPAINARGFALNSASATRSRTALSLV